MSQANGEKKGFRNDGRTWSWRREDGDTLTTLARLHYSTAKCLEIVNNELSSPKRTMNSRKILLQPAAGKAQKPGGGRNHDPIAQLRIRKSFRMVANKDEDRGATARRNAMHSCRFLIRTTELRAQMTQPKESRPHSNSSATASTKSALVRERHGRGEMAKTLPVVELLGTGRPRSRQTSRDEPDNEDCSLGSDDDSSVMEMSPNGFELDEQVLDLLQRKGQSLDEQLSRVSDDDSVGEVDEEEEEEENDERELGSSNSDDDSEEEDSMDRVVPVVVADCTGRERLTTTEKQPSMPSQTKGTATLKKLLMRRTEPMPRTRSSKSVTWAKDIEKVTVVEDISPVWRTQESCVIQ